MKHLISYFLYYKNSSKCEIHTHVYKSPVIRSNMEGDLFPFIGLIILNLLQSNPVDADTEGKKLSILIGNVRAFFPQDKANFL